MFRFIWGLFKFLVVLTVIAAVGLGIYMAWRLNTDTAETFVDPKAQFKYGSTGGDKNFGLPYPIWQIMPVLFRKHMPKGREDEGWAAFGFIYEDKVHWPQGMHRNRPVGTTLRNYQGVERIFVNCAACHVGKVRAGADSEPEIIVGMPANTIDLQAFQDFMVASAKDERFTPEDIIAEIDAEGIPLDLINRLIYKFYAVYMVRQRILTIADRFRFADYEPRFGPGRFDTFSPAKALFNWPVDAVPAHERIGVVDYPSVWLQRQRIGMKLHWDGNNTKVEERNRSAAFGTGALPPVLDRSSISRMETFLLDAKPPEFAEMFPEHLDRALAEKGRPIYEAECAECHGASSKDFTGEYVGTVAPIEEIGTDRHRLDNYTQDLAYNQNLLYGGWGEERFQNFRKTHGYANQPLDGIWLRAPYLHNGSVPTLWDLLQPPEDRPSAFFRGSDRYYPVNVGFETRPEVLSAEDRAHLFCYQTEAAGRPRCGLNAPDNHGTCTTGDCPGNGKGGHLYGTTLSEPDKRALIEYLKTF